VEDLLLTGEDSASLIGRDAEHWVALYAECLASNRRTLDLMRNQGHEQEVRFLEAHVRQLERRLAFWNDRRLQ
jgi:hypothetical protein